MKKAEVFHILFCFTLGIFYFALSAEASIFYVSVTGDDIIGNGSQINPWRTVQKGANSATSPGDIVRIMPGSYGEYVQSKAAGTSGNPITFIGDGGYASLQRFDMKHAYLVLDNIEFTGRNEPNGMNIFINASNQVIKNCYVHNDLNLNVYGVYAGIAPFPLPDNVLIQNCVFKNQGGPYIFAGLTNSTITQNQMTDNSSRQEDAMRIGGHDVVISDNYFENINWIDPLGNHPDLIQTSGQWWADAYNIIFDRNYAKNCKAQIGHTAQFGKANVRDWTFRNNVFVDIYHTLNIGLPNAEIYNNTFININDANDGHAIILEYQDGVYNADNSKIVNNMFIGSGGSSINQGWYLNNHGYSLLADYNYVTHSSPTYDPKNGFAEPHGVNGGDPKFVNYLTVDFNLQADSPAVNKGTTLSDFSIDKDGTSRPQGSGWDIGAYEYVETGADTTPPSAPAGVAVQ